MKKIAKVAKSKRFDVLMAENHILIRAGTYVTLMRILHHNRLLEKKLAPLRHDSHVVLRTRIIRDRVIMENYGLVITVALRHRRDDIPFDDLKGYGAEGLIKAVDGFDSRKGSKFSSYAGACISNTIMRSVVENETFIRIPEHRAIEKKRKSREETKAQVKGNVITGKSSKKMERIDPEISFSIDDCKEGDDGDKLASCLVSENILSPEDFVLRKSNEKSREQAVTLLKENLSENEWFILRGGFCFETEEPMTLRKMGDVLGLSHENVRKKMKKSLGKAQRVLSRNSLVRESFF